MRDRIDEATAKQTIEDRMILAACVLVASLFLLAGTRIYRRMTEQSEQLEISEGIVANQEPTIRAVFFGVLAAPLQMELRVRWVKRGLPAPPG